MTNENRVIKRQPRRPVASRKIQVARERQRLRVARTIALSVDVAKGSSSLFPSGQRTAFPNKRLLQRSAGSPENGEPTTDNDFFQLTTWNLVLHSRKEGDLS